MMQNQRIIIYVFIAVLVLLTVFMFNSVLVYRLADSRLSVKDILNASINQEAQAAIKLNHARTREAPYDIGIFGNSRAFMISAADLKLNPGETFFNFSNGGSAFVQSVKLIEELAKEDVLPKTVLVSLDHPQIQYTGYVKYPNPLFQLDDIGVDFFTIVFAPYGSLKQRLSDAFKVLDWAKGHTWKSVKNAWKLDILLHRLNFAVHLLKDGNIQAPENHANYRSDGSIVQVIPNSPTDFSNQTFGYEGLRGWDRHVYLGLKRLDAVAKTHGVRIVVYESPIWPRLKSSDTHIRKDAKDTHKWFVEGCLETAIECIRAWKLEGEHGDYWPDCCHAPAADLGAYLRNHVLNNQVLSRAF